MATPDKKQRKLTYDRFYGGWQLEGKMNVETSIALNGTDIITSSGVDLGSSNYTTGGQFVIDSDGTAVGASGALTVGVGSDAGLFHNGTNTILENQTGDLIIQTQGTGGGIIIDSEDDTFEFKASGTVIADLDLSTGLNIFGAAGSAGVLTLSTNETTVVDGDKLGQIDFQAPVEADGSDSILVAGSIWVEADATFDATTNDSDMVFALGASETATEKARITSGGIFSATGIYGNNLNGGTLRAAVIDSVTGEIGYDSSSKRYKQDIEDVGDTSWIYDIPIVSYRYKKNPKNEQVGVIAEDIDKYSRVYCSYNDDGQVEAVHHQKFVYPLWNELKKLRKEIDELKSVKRQTKKVVKEN